MRRQHVVVRSDDTDVHLAAGADDRLVLAAGGKAVREVAAAQIGAVNAAVAFARNQFEVAGATCLGAFDDPIGNRGDFGVQA